MDLLEQSVLMDNLDMESPPMDSISGILWLTGGWCHENNWGVPWMSRGV